MYLEVVGPAALLHPAHKGTSKHAQCSREGQKAQPAVPPCLQHAGVVLVPAVAVELLHLDVVGPAALLHPCW